MRKALLLACILPVYVFKLSAQQDSLQFSIYFNTGSFEISEDKKREIWYLVDSLGNRIKRITIIGNTDDVGNPQSNLNLARQRANSVGAVLKSLLKHHTENFHFAINGEGNALYDNGTAEGRRLNRRSDIIFYLLKNEVTEVAPTEPFRCGNLDKFYYYLSFPLQEFCIDVTKDTFLVGERGTIIHHKGNTIKRDALSCRCFTLRLNEYYDKSDFTLNNLTTTSDGQMLESGGMIKLDGYCGGTKYDLKTGEFFTVMVPADTILPGMKLLSANRDTDSAYLDWQIDRFDPDVDNFDYYKMLRLCKGTAPVPAGNCRFFFCKIERFFRSKKYQSQKDLRVNAASDKEKTLLEAYELKGEDLAVALEKSKENTGKDALKYYVYKSYDWDYRNIDRYKPGMEFVNYIVQNKPDPETDVKIVFKNSKTAIPCFEKSDRYAFKEVSANAAIWVIGLRYTFDKQIYLALEEANTSDKKITLNFRPVSVDELKTALKKID